MNNQTRIVQGNNFAFTITMGTARYTIQGVPDDDCHWFDYRLRVTPDLSKLLPKHHEPPADLSDALVSIKQAANMIKVHPSTIRHWIASCRLVAWKGGDRRGGNWWRIPRALVEQARVVKCNHCSKQFNSRTPNRQRFCSNSCRSRAHARKRRRLSAS